MTLAEVEPAPPDRAEFARLVEPHRRELQLHCYRMLGSFHDAEDLVQETMLRGWRGFDAFEARSGLRSWLYRIATNACLNALASRKRLRRMLPEREAPPSSRLPGGGPAPELPWLEPYRDALLEGIPDTALGPEGKYEMRQTVRLAFIEATQRLPPRQRAALLLCDVLGFSASEAAGVLETSTAAVNSAVQRARATLEHPGTDERPADGERQQALLDRYVAAWEGADIDAFVSLLRQDAIVSMPPWPQWYRGRADVGIFIAWAWERVGGRSRLLPTRANDQRAFAVYVERGARFEAHSIHVLAVDVGRDRAADRVHRCTPRAGIRSAEHPRGLTQCWPQAAQRSRPTGGAWRLVRA